MGISQNSDGLGEGFEQQSFASYEIEDDYNCGYDEDEYIEPEYVMASFDWETNDYEFTLVTPKQDLEFDAAIKDLCVKADDIHKKYSCGDVI